VQLMWKKVQMMHFYLQDLAPVCHLLHIFLFDKSTFTVCATEQYPTEG